MQYDPVTQDQVIIDKKQLPSMRAVTFNSSGSKLLGSLYLTGGKQLQPTVVLAHGFPGNEHNQDLAHAVRRAGFNVLIFHYRGSWGSEGVFSFSNSIEDIISAFEFVKSEKVCGNYNLDPKRVVFIGHSMGGFATFVNAEKLKGVNNLGFIAGFNFGVLADLIKLPFAEEKVLEHLGAGAEMVAGTNAKKLLKEIVENKDRFNILNYVKALSEKNLLMIASKHDSTAMINFHHKPLMKAFKKHKLLREVIIDGGHVFSTKRIELARCVVNWLNSIKFNETDAE
ncbi:MAG: alpha/beta fold hydrolase [Melioribacteraceae bacterium]|nr:alpha/beta fold hydrolase [Melioribacteraceae bacterium]